MKSVLRTFTGLSPFLPSLKIISIFYFNKYIIQGIDTGTITFEIYSNTI